MPENITPKFYDSLYTVLVESTSDDWYEHYGKLKKFLSENNNRFPSYNEEGGNWVNRQRFLFKKNRLLSERIDLLLELKDWTWDLIDSRWYKKFEELKVFMQENNGNVPRQDGKGYDPLADWASKQRKYQSSGKLRKDRFQLLDSLDGWEWQPFDERFEEKLKKLKINFKKNNKFPPARTKYHLDFKT